MIDEYEFFRENVFLRTSSNPLTYSFYIFNDATPIFRYVCVADTFDISVTDGFVAVPSFPVIVKTSNNGQIGITALNYHKINRNLIDLMIDIAIQEFAPLSLIENLKSRSL